MKLLQLKWLMAGMVISSFLLALFSFTNSSQSEYEPVLMHREDMEAAVQLRASRDIIKPGKIWVYNQFIFVIEQYKGIHILDNTDASDPENIGFIQIDGCTDVAVKEDIIYANNAVDLIGVKAAADYKAISVVSRNRNILPALESPEDWYSHDFEKHRPANTIIVRWEPYNVD